MKKTLYKIIFYIALICIVFGIFLFVGNFAANNIGVRTENIEADIRSSQSINEDWIVDGNVGNTAAAFISYPKNNSDHTFSVYVKHSGVSFGYFFRAGGSVGEIDDGIACFTVSGCDERAFISMNKQKAVKLISAGEEFELDGEKPFAIVVPVNAGNVTFYDSYGNTVEYNEHSM